MSLRSAISYHGRVNLVGKSVLRYQRMRSEWKAGKSPKDQNAYLAPSLKSGHWLKELISSHYLQGRYANIHKKVAWVTSGGPVEFLKALGYFTYYPENHGAVCGVRRRVVPLSKESEKLGYCRDLCSYARTDIGSVITGKSPVGNLPRPDLLVCCTNICQTVMYWYQFLSDHFKVPLIVIDTPFIYDKVTQHAVDYVTRQIEKAVETAERVAGYSLSEKNLRRTGRAAKDAMLLWNEILKCCRHRPSPISAFDQFFFMAPIVDMRGEALTVAFYRRVLDEIQQRIAKGTGAVIHEKKRVLWDNLPIWHHVRPLSELFAETGYCVVASTYTNAWAELADMVKPDAMLESGARAYLHVILNRSAGHKLETMIHMIKEYDIDGVVLHSNRSCKPYSIGQMDQRQRLLHEQGIPTLLLDADHNDPRSFSEKYVTDSIAAFIEMVERT